MSKNFKSGLKNTASSVKGAGKNFVNQGWSAIPMPVKGILFLIVGYGVYKLSKTLIANSRLDKNTQDVKQETDGWNVEAVKDDKIKKATLSSTQQKSLANKIHSTMDGYGTRDYDLKMAFRKVRNNADFSGLSRAYGRRTLQPGHGMGWMVASFTGSMVQCIQDDASSSTIDFINKELKQKGIKYRV